ncbi:MAG: AAA family ATPase [Rhodospirillales bacterium]|nr:AAA family ATPase [Rhodospirillales bacterium]
MDAVRNPFAPGAGTPPPALIGRKEILRKAEVTLARIREGRPAKSLLLVGLRGVGKTVLLVRFQEFAEKAAYKAVLVEAHESKSLAALLMPPLRQILLSLDRFEKVSVQVKRGLRVLKSFARTVKIKLGDFEIGLDIEPEHGSADSGDLEADLPELLVAIAEAAAARNSAIGIIIDEMQYLSEEELSALIMGVHKVTQRQLPLVVLGAGLPQLVGLSGKSKSYAERLFDFPEVGALKPADARNALQEPVRREAVEFQSKALDDIVRVTQGYPYFLQEWGYHAWNIAQSSPITAETVRDVTRSAIASLDESFFRVRFDRLTPREKSYLRAMAARGSGPHRSGEIADMLGVAVHTVAPLRGGLIRKGMIYSPAHGDTAFTVPLFDEFLKRIMPDAKRK